MFKQEYEALKKIGKRIMIHAYKFNGWLYRSWEYPMIIENNDDYVVLSNCDSKIMTSEFQTNRFFTSETRHPSFWIMFKEHWFNLLISLIDGKPNFYINLSSKFIYEESAIKYIDFDLDFKISWNNNWVELDKHEYKEAITKFNYPTALVEKIDEIESQVVDLIKKQYFVNEFTIDKLNGYFSKYQELLKDEKKTND